jgi:formamidopyrimidine-DNA glycosylase
MPELPDIVTYIRALESRIVGERLIRVRVASTFLLRSAQPPIREAEGLSFANCAESGNESRLERRMIFGWCCI